MRGEQGRMSGAGDWEAALRSLFGAGVEVRVATAAMYAAPTLADEAAPLAGAVARRRAEFAAGRACAREALAALGVAAGPIPIGPGRDPVWPAGHVGAITHCEGLCAAVVASGERYAALGVDAEDAAPLSPGVLGQVCGQAELSAFEALGHWPPALWGTLAFCAKEAFYKAWFPLARTRLGFRDAVISFETGPDGGGGAFQVAIGEAPLGERAAHFVGRWRLTDRYVLAGVSLEAGSPRVA
jgi:4'-phosphopantetheinyl transferase EntD